MKVKFIKTFTVVLFQFVLFQVVTTNFSLAQNLTKKDAEGFCRGWLTGNGDPEWNTCVTTQMRRSIKEYNSLQNFEPTDVAQQTQAAPLAVRPSLQDAKAKCIDLGFKAGTEKFGTCVLKLSK
jgi:hypothetical protein